MKKKVLTLLLFIGFTGLIFYPGCKTTEEAAQYTLTVSVGEGVTGTPATGTYSHSENDVVYYSYSSQPKFGNLTVTLNSTGASTTGSITMNSNHTLTATAIIDVRGDKWTGLAQNDDEPGINYYSEFTFSGGISSGTATGYIETLGSNLQGPWTFDGSELAISLGLGVDTLTMRGTFTDENHLSGTWEWDEYGNPQTGTWSVER